MISNRKAELPAWVCTFLDLSSCNRVIVGRMNYRWVLANAASRSLLTKSKTSTFYSIDVSQMLPYLQLPLPIRSLYSAILQLLQILWRSTFAYADTLCLCPLSPLSNSFSLALVPYSPQSSFFSGLLLDQNLHPLDLLYPPDPDLHHFSHTS